MIDDIVKALRRNANVHDWQVLRKQTSQRELYLIGEAEENARAARSESAMVTLFHDRDGKRGSATLTFTPGETADPDSRIRQGVFTASLALNPPYQLAGAAPQPDVQVRDPLLAEHPEQVIGEWRKDLVATVKGEPKVRLSAAEFFVYENRVDFLNSRGASFSYPATRAHIEFVLLSREGAVESENYHSVTVRSAADLDLAAVTRKRAALARDMLRVTLPETWDGPVVITDDSLGVLFRPMLNRVRAEMLYRGVYKTKVGDSIFGDRLVTGDPLDLAGDSTLPYGVDSAPADAEGLPGRRLEILRAGHVQSIMASKRFADYLGVAPTGTSGNVVVAPGQTAETDLLKGPVYHLVSFAALDSDPMTGEFATEIRLGYKIEADGTRRPVKGGSVSGNVFDAFAACRLSRETVKAGSYFGPRSIRFDRLVISGK